MQRSRLHIDQIRIGQPLPFDTFDAMGNLLLRKGYVLDDLSQAERLVERGLFAEGGVDGAIKRADRTALVDIASTRLRGKKVSIFALLDECQETLEKHVEDRGADFVEGVLDVAALIQRACKLDADAALASTLLRNAGRYSIRRLIQTALVVELLLLRLERADQERRTAVAAALTRDIAMLSLQDVLYHQATPPDETQRVALHTHPHDGAEMLRASGVTDPIWLEIVRQHHETIDGQGYPDGLKSDAILETSQIVSLADRYGALVSGRAYRSALLPSAALREIFTGQGKSVQASHVALLVKEVGVYPPGSIVLLANGDTAVVLKRMPHAHQPVVRCIRNNLRQRLPGAPKRLTKEAVFAVKGSIPASDLNFVIDPAQIWEETFEVESG
jgi:hypothetical protein